MTATTTKGKSNNVIDNDNQAINKKLLRSILKECKAILEETGAYLKEIHDKRH